MQRPERSASTPDTRLSRPPWSRSGSVLTSVGARPDPGRGAFRSRSASSWSWSGRPDPGRSPSWSWSGVGIGPLWAVGEGYERW